MCLTTCSLFKASTHPAAYAAAKRFSSTLYPRVTLLNGQETRLTKLWSEFKNHQDNNFFSKSLFSRQEVKSFSQKMHTHGIYTAETIPQAHAPSTVYLPELPSALLMRSYGRNCLSNENALPGVFKQGFNSEERIALIQLNKHIYRVSHTYEKGVCARLFIDKGPTQLDVKKDTEGWLESMFKDVIFKERIEFETEGAAKGLPKEETLYFHIDGHLKTLQTRKSFYDKTGKLARQFFETSPSGSVSCFSWYYNSRGELTGMDTPTGTVKYRRDKTGNLIERTFATGLTGYYTYDANKNLTTLREVSLNHDQRRLWVYIHHDNHVEELDSEHKENIHIFNASKTEVELASFFPLNGKPINRRIRWIYNEVDLAVWKKMKKNSSNEIITAYDVWKGVMLPSKVSLSNKTIAYQTDSLGRPLVKTESVKGIMNTIHFTYEGLFLTSERHSNGKCYFYHYDTAGNLSKQLLGEEIEREYFYDLLGRMIIQVNHSDPLSTEITRYHYEGDISTNPSVLPNLKFKVNQNVALTEMSCNPWGGVRQTSRTKFRAEHLSSHKPARL